jgi:hypothetical protein
VEGDSQLRMKSTKLEVSKCTLEARSWKLEGAAIGNWKLEVESWKLALGRAKNSKRQLRPRESMRKMVLASWGYVVGS